MRARILVLSIALLGVMGSCSEPKNTFSDGDWLGILNIDTEDPSLQVPFNMRHYTDAKGVERVEVINADEVITVTEIGRLGDTIFMRMPVFTSEFYFTVRNDSLVGTYYPKGKSMGNGYEFYGVKGETNRFPWATDAPVGNVGGRWEMVENPGQPDSSVMIGEFTQNEGVVTGSVLSPGGDMRYLQGVLSGSKFMLSGVDGAHTVVFTATLSENGQLVDGRFLGSPRWRSTWTATRNDTITLPQSDELVRVKLGSEPFTFALPNSNGDTISLNDDEFKGKVVIVSASGSWCPNCMDETRLFAEFYNKYSDKGLRVVALCFESNDREASFRSINRFKEQTGATYPFLYAGARGKENRDSILYVLEGQMAYPTSIIIDKSGEIRSVHTGFSGPGTGVHYTEYVDKTTKLIESLLAE